MNIEQIQQNWMMCAKIWNTFSVAWHPTYLVMLHVILRMCNTYSYKFNISGLVQRPSIFPLKKILHWTGVLLA